MAHQDIRRLTNELDAVKNNNIEPVGMLQRAMFLKTYIEFNILLSVCLLLFKLVTVSSVHIMYIQPMSLVCPAGCLQSFTVYCLIVNIQLFMCSPLPGTLILLVVRLHAWPIEQPGFLIN